MTAPEGRWRYDPYENGCDFWKAEGATPSLNGKEDVALYLDALEAEVAALREILLGLYNMQNGPPLIKYADEWHAVMAKAERLLLTPTNTAQKAHE